MNGREARRLCPHAVVVTPRMQAYTEASRAVFAVFADTGQQAQAFFQQPWILVTFALMFVALAMAMFGTFELIAFMHFFHIQCCLLDASYGKIHGFD